MSAAGAGSASPRVLDVADQIGAVAELDLAGRVAALRDIDEALRQALEEVR